MIIVLVRHVVKPGMLDKAIARVDSNGDQMSKLPGFLFRHRLRSKNDPMIVSTVTAWTDEASFDAWNKIKAGLPDSGESPYLRADSERHFVESSHGT